MIQGAINDLALQLVVSCYSFTDATVKMAVYGEHTF